MLQQRATFGAAGAGSRSGHVERTRSEGVFSFCCGWFVEFFLRLATGILVAALPILAIGQKVPPEKLPHSALLAREPQVPVGRTGRTNGSGATWAAWRNCWRTNASAATWAWFALCAFVLFDECFLLISLAVATLLWIWTSKVPLRASFAIA